MNVIIYSREDALLIFRRNIYAELHQHHAIQVTLAMDQPFEANVEGVRGHYSLLVIGSDRRHQVFGRDAWVATLLLNPETMFARAVQSQLLAGRDFYTPPANELKLPAFPEEAPDYDTLDDYLMLAQRALLPAGVIETPLDSRIRQALEIVRGQADTRISARALSQQICLSESRLGHLFKAEVGIPLRRYLLWVRLMRAAQFIARGERFTFAAHETGFTDSAHLSRTFAMMFGLRLSDLFRDREAVRVIFCEEATPPVSDGAE